MHDLIQKAQNGRREYIEAMKHGDIAPDADQLVRGGECSDCQNLIRKRNIPQLTEWLGMDFEGKYLFFCGRPIRGDDATGNCGCVMLETVPEGIVTTLTVKGEMVRPAGKSKIASAGCPRKIDPRWGAVQRRKGGLHH